MLSEVTLQNFKCFNNVSIKLGNLTILAGLNGSGKSSLIQSLLVLRQSFLSGDLLDGRLDLDGELIKLGTGRDLLNEDAEENKLGFQLESTLLKRHWALNFDYLPDSDQLNAEPKRSHRPPSYVQMPWRTKPPFGGKFEFISADRFGPKKLYPKSETMARNGSLGAKGEFTLNYLFERKSEILSDDDPRLASNDKLRLIDNVDHWLNAVSPGVNLELEAIPTADAIVAGYSYDRKGDIASRPFRATNVGFGLSYVLPVITSLFLSKGTLLALENPEAHLHPKGQTKLAELAVKAANAGLQVIIETHSDHFLDGVRIAVRNELIRPDQVVINFFERTDIRSSIHSPTIDRNGRLSSWPKGFFDERDENLAKLVGPKSS